jgi:calcineurin-like phosphoesterase family protein
MYAPCNDPYTEENRTEFDNTLNENINKVKDNDRLYVMEDLNVKVGQRRQPW